MKTKTKGKMKCLLTFTEDILGTLAGNEEVATEFIMTKHPDGLSKDELDAQREVDEVTEKSSTIFARTDDKPHLWDYQVKGYLKGACEAMISAEQFTQEELKKVRLTRYLFKKTIDNLIHIYPRKIFLILPDGCDKDKLSFCQRPLRGETMKGERIALARSEVAPAGTQIEIVIDCDNPKHWDYIPIWLDRGIKLGLGQWRSGGKGRFEWKELTSE